MKNSLDHLDASSHDDRLNHMTIEDGLRNTVKIQL